MGSCLRRQKTEETLEQALDLSNGCRARVTRAGHQIDTEKDGLTSCRRTYLIQFRFCDRRLVELNKALPDAQASEELHMIYRQHAPKEHIITCGVYHAQKMLLHNSAS